MFAALAGVDLAPWLAAVAPGREEAFAEVVVSQPSFVEGLGPLLTEERIEDWRAWLTFKVIHAAAAFLSPAGASLEQLLIAALFLLVRIGGALLVCVTAAWGAGRVASWALSGMATRGTRSGYRNRHPGR